MSTTKCFQIAAIFLIPWSCSNSNLEHSTDSHENANHFLKNIISDSDSPGIQYMIVNADSTIFECNDGLSNLESNTVISPLTTFNAFSVTKTFTALAILQLEEQGQLDIEDCVRSYVDSLLYKTTFTIRQLLNHTSGLPNPMPLKWVHLFQEHNSFNYEEYVKDVLEENSELDDIPGVKYSYSNIGYLLLGKIIEKVSGEDYRTYIKNNIIRRLSLTGDAYLGFDIPDTLTHAHGYIKRWSFLNFGLNFVFDKGRYVGDTYNGWNQFRYFYMNGYAFGGLIGNARGFSKYLQALLRDNQLITHGSKVKLFEPQKTNNGKTIDRCLSWFRGKLGSDIYYSHSGGGGGYYCEIRIYPDRRIASVVMFNRTGVSEEKFLDNVDKFFLLN